MGPFIIVALRLVLPLTIFRWPLLGGLIAMIADALDVVLITYLNMGDFKNYHQVDKYLDMYYLSMEVYVSLFWKNKLARGTSIFLFLYRTIGFILFEVTKLRLLLFIFPNLFENFYLFYLGYKKITKKDPISSFRNLFLILVLLLIPKLIQEYILHFALLQPWNWIKFNILNIKS